MAYLDFPHLMGSGIPTLKKMGNILDLLGLVFGDIGYYTMTAAISAATEAEERVVSKPVSGS